ncbi:MAG TPA: c-type cytochrome [Burkholderiaceae bacterium]|nr:c-type cytochrome [Burkholderiaceae bacterium]
MESSVAIGVLAAALLTSTARAADVSADPQAALLAASCNACHGPNGASVAGIPALNGRNADELATALLDYKYGRRTGTVMNRHARGYSDDELRAMAREFARAQPAAAGQR